MGRDLFEVHDFRIHPLVMKSSFEYLKSFERVYFQCIYSIIECNYNPYIKILLLRFSLISLRQFIQNRIK